jgi:aminopeptidase N
MAVEINRDGMLGYVWDSYESSLPMSTYLVAFLVSEFINVESDPSLSRVQFRIWARPSFRNQTEYARDIGPRILNFYETFFNIKFPLPKQDMAAIPDFAAGAMENWGLITYRYLTTSLQLSIAASKSGALQRG